jgi:hypothetical protein
MNERAALESAIDLYRIAKRFASDLIEAAGVYAEQRAISIGRESLTLEPLHTQLKNSLKEFPLTMLPPGVAAAAAEFSAEIAHFYFSPAIEGETSFEDRSSLHIDPGAVFSVARAVDRWHRAITNWWQEITQLDSEDVTADLEGIYLEPSDKTDIVMVCGFWEGLIFPCSRRNRDGFPIAE